MNAKFNVNIYFISPGDEIFATMNVWPISPKELRLSNMNHYTHLRLTKKSKVTKKDECEAASNYVYGGKI